jgi:hypothetical protein
VLPSASTKEAFAPASMRTAGAAGLAGMVEAVDFVGDVAALDSAV